jgi:CBS domain-containing protein
MNSVLVGSIDAVTRRRLVTTRAEVLLPEVAKLLSDCAMTGVITKTDIVRKLGQCAATAANTAAAEAMTREVIHCRPGDALEEVLQLMKEHSLVHVPVIDAQSKPTGVMEARDALRALMADASYEISWLRDYIMGVGYR